MKKFKSLLCFAVLVCTVSALCIGVHAETYSGACGASDADTVNWSLDTDTGALVISGSGAMKEYYCDYGCYAPWYDYRSSIQSVTVYAGVTNIGDFAFYGCASLTSVIIPEGVTRIGEAAFDSCALLPSVVIPESVTRIGDWAFYACKSLTSVTIPGSVTSIGWGAFYWCSSLTSVTVPVSVTNIGADAFGNCHDDLIMYGYTGSYAQTYAEENNIPFVALDAPAPEHSGTCGDGVTWALYADGTLVISGSGAMADYTASTDVPWCDYTGDITAITVKNGVTSIGGHAFCSCKAVPSIEIPESVTSIGAYAFYWCTSLTSVTIPGSVASIGYEAFGDCYSLISVTISEGVESIGVAAFDGCDSLTSVAIPGSVTSIGGWVFVYCDALASVTISEGVESIGDYAFYGCAALTSVVIPNSVTSIGDYAFSYCHADLTIYGYAGSYAEAYAKENNIPFVELDTSTLLGNADGDGEITVLDAVAVLQYCANMTPEAFVAQAADTIRMESWISEMPCLFCNIAQI